MSGSSSMMRMRFISNQGGETVSRVYSRWGDWGRAEGGGRGLREGAPFACRGGQAKHVQGKQSSRRGETQEAHDVVPLPDLKIGGHARWRMDGGTKILPLRGGSCDRRTTDFGLRGLREELTERRVQTTRQNQ